MNAWSQKVNVIRRMMGGKAYKASTRATPLRAALEQLRRFEAAPEHYSPTGRREDAPEPLYLDVALAEHFLLHSQNVDRNSPAWAKKQQGYLAWWAERLARVNLRKASLRDHVLPALERVPARGHRIAVLMRLYSFLLKVEHRISAGEDPTFGTLPVPQVQPAQWKRVKAMPREHYLLAREHLTGGWRDCLDVLAGTGWHVTELDRFIRGGRTEPNPKRAAAAESVAGVLVVPSHKNGEEARTAVSQSVLEAAQRLLERKTLSIKTF